MGTVQNAAQAVQDSIGAPIYTEKLNDHQRIVNAETKGNVDKVRQRIGGLTDQVDGLKADTSAALTAYLESQGFARQEIESLA